MENRSPLAQACANPHCTRHKIHAANRCQACYSFLRRHGRDATPADMVMRKKEEGNCCNCGAVLVYARARCKRCYQYRLRTGRERLVERTVGKGLCLNCGERPRYRRGRCRSCFGYLRLHRRDRQEAAS